MSDHGYVPYTRGCRCEVCKAAKAAYMRAKRASALAAIPDGAPITERGRYVAPIEKHGTAHGYKDHKCRCLDCTAYQAAEDRRRLERRAS